MSWGYKILIVYIVFVLGISFLVYRSSVQNEDLVTENYYEKELKYQDRIDTEKRTAQLAQPVVIEQQHENFVIRFPKEFLGKKVTGDITLYCPSDQRKDKKQNFELPDTSTPVLFETDNKGMNILQISWECDGKTYYYEKRVIIKA